MAEITSERVWKALEEVKDPEIPVVSVVEMGIVREVAVEGARVIVTMTPTFSGCPALVRIREDIAARVRALGAGKVEVRTVLTPPWTSDWITEGARDKLRAFGLGPPPRQNGSADLVLLDAALCPYCGSTRTRLKSAFGSTLCRAIYYCSNCQQPFEQFKGL